MRYTTIWSSAARRELYALSPEIGVALLEQVEGPIAENPHRLGKEMRPPFEGTWSARRSEYRIFYKIDESKHAIVITGVHHRSTAYAPRRTRKSH